MRQANREHAKQASNRTKGKQIQNKQSRQALRQKVSQGENKQSRRAIGQTENRRVFAIFIHSFIGGQVRALKEESVWSSQVLYVSITDAVSRYF